MVWWLSPFFFFFFFLLFIIFIISIIILMMMMMMMMITIIIPLSFGMEHRLLGSSSRGFQAERGRSQAFSSFSEIPGRGQPEVGDGPGGYLSAVFSSVKQRAAMLRRPQIGPTPETGSPASPPSPRGDDAPAGAADPSYLEPQGEELPLSSQTIPLGDGAALDRDAAAPILSDHFERFRSEQEARLRQWLDEGQQDQGSG